MTYTKGPCQLEFEKIRNLKPKGSLKSKVTEGLKIFDLNAGKVVREHFASNPEYELYDKLLELIEQLESADKNILDNDTTRESKYAAKLMVYKLHKVLDEFNDIMTKLGSADTNKDEREVCIYQLAIDSSQIIYDYTPSLIATPGFWNQLAVKFINWCEGVLEYFNMIEQTMLPDVTYYERTTFFNSEHNPTLIQEFSLAKAQIYEIKTKAETEAAKGIAKDIGL